MSRDLLTKHLLLRTPVPADAPAIQHIASDPRVALTTASIRHRYRRDAAVRFIEKIHLTGWSDRMNTALISLATGKLIRMAGYLCDRGEAGLGYMVSPDHLGQGLATEAASRLMAHIFERTSVEAVTAGTMTVNPVSEAVLRKLGFRRERQESISLPVREAVYSVSFWRLDRSC